MRSCCLRRNREPGVALRRAAESFGPGNSVESRLSSLSKALVALVDGAVSFWRILFKKDLIRSLVLVGGGMLSDVLEVDSRSMSRLRSGAFLDMWLHSVSLGSLSCVLGG